MSIFWIKNLIDICLTATKSKKDLVLENLALRQQLTVLKGRTKRPKLTESDRRFWVELSKAWDKWKSVLIIVQPDTVVKWHQRLAKRNWARKSKRPPGRKPTDPEIVKIIHKLAYENILWGASRIHGELLKLGFQISERTVARYLPKDRPRSQTWSKFLRNHISKTIAIDLFSVFTVGFRQLYGIVIIEHETRKILLTNATYFPNQFWVTQQLLNAFPGECSHKYLISDNDPRFSAFFGQEISDLLGIRNIKTSVGSPWQNGICERVIGTIRRECLDHVVILGPCHLQSILHDFQNYYNEDRTHISISKCTPEGRTTSELINSPSLRKLKISSRISGLHHRYRWNAV